MGSLKFDQITFNSRFETLNCILNINDVLMDTLLVEILQRLPCIDVVRVKSVCKRWKLVISEAYFVPNYIRYQGRIQSQLSTPFTLVYQFLVWHHVLTDEPESRVLSISDNPFFQTQKFALDFLPCFRSWRRHPIWVAASCKDLLVCCETKISAQSIYYVCNPLTKQWVATPPISGQTLMAGTAMGLVVSDLGQFRIVRVPELDSNESDPNSNRFEADVFCSEKGKWTKIAVTSPVRFRRSWHFKSEATVFDNKLHWLINSDIIIVYDPFEGIESSLCRVINLPPELSAQAAICLGSSRGCLKVCQLKGGYPNGQIIVWKLGNYLTKKWELECKISLREVVFVDNMYFNEYGCYIVEVLALHPCDSMILYLRIRNYIALCNLGSRTIEVVSECLEDSTFSVGTCGVFMLMHPPWPSSLVTLRS